MSSRHLTSAGDLSRQAKREVRALRKTLAELQGHAHPPTFTRVAEEIRKELGLSSKGFDPLITEAEDRAAEAQRELAKRLKERAEAADCQFSYKSPHLSFGCVTLYEKKKGEWEVSVLDSVPLDKIYGNNADVLADTALRLINDIDEALARVDSFIRDLRRVHQHMHSLAPDLEGLSPNLLMVLCASGQNFRRHLTTGVTDGRKALSRPQMSYLLRRTDELSRRGEIPLQLRLTPATQHVKGESFRYLTVPRNSNPRIPASGELVRKVNLIDKEG